MKGKDLIQRKNINRLAIPAIFAGIAEPVISLVDTAFVGQIGSEELAAVGISSSFYTLCVWILAQTLTAIDAIVSRNYGLNSLKRLGTLIPQALVFNIGVGVLVYLSTSFFAESIFKIYEAKGQVLENCVTYFTIRAIGFPFTLGTFLLFGTFRGLQNTSWAMTISIAGAVVNIALDYVLIFGVEGVVSPMGIKGAAIASLVAQISMFILALIYLLRKTPFKLQLSLRINPMFSWLLGMGWDLLIRTVLLNATFYLATRYATGYGTEVIAAHTIALNIWLFSSFFIDGYAHAGNAISGRLLGLKDLKSLAALGKKIGKISLVIGVGLSTLYLLGYPITGRVFSEDPAVIEAFNNVFWLVIVTQPINALAFAFDGIYKGLGETKVLRNLLIGATLLGFIPTILLFHYFSPSLTGIWISFLVWMCIRSGGLVVHFRKRYAQASQLTH